MCVCVLHCKAAGVSEQTESAEHGEGCWKCEHHRVRHQPSPRWCTRSCGRSPVGCCHTGARSPDSVRTINSLRRFAPKCVSPMFHACDLHLQEAVPVAGHRAVDVQHVIFGVDPPNLEERGKRRGRRNDISSQNKVSGFGRARVPLVRKL